MMRFAKKEGKRDLRYEELNADFIIVGGGISGTCAAITAARQGIKVILVQDRPVLGGNASSEVRLWILGATSHMGNNNRWSPEGGVIDEILVENTFRNKEGNSIIFDTILLEKVTDEPNITLLLNTSVFDLSKKDKNNISFIKAFCGQNETEYILKASLFCDASGDGILGYLAGASYLMGAEKSDEFGELFTPTDEYGELLGHSIYFYSKNVGKPVKYVAPSFALKDIKEIPRFRNINSDEHGCKFWWFEYGGRLDTIKQSEDIKWELWRVVYGAWDYIKNSGNYPDAENLTLEWVGLIPGKRESRRFEGLYMLRQQDIIEQRYFYDAVAFGGWAIDLHPADGVYSELPGCNQYHSKGIYQIPYRCLISKDIKNLFIAGRLISATHVAFGSTRVMATSAHSAQAIGMAAALCGKKDKNPSYYAEKENIIQLQQMLNVVGQSIPGLSIDKNYNLAFSAMVKASSTLALTQIPFNGKWMTLSYSAGQLLPLKKGMPYRFEIEVDASCQTDIEVELRASSKEQNFTPDLLIEKQNLILHKGIQKVAISFTNKLVRDQYCFFIFRKNPHVKIRCSEQLITGIVSVFNKTNPAVNNFGKQNPPANSGFEEFEFWCPERRPSGQNIAMNINPGINCFLPENIKNGFVRPNTVPNAWVANPNDVRPKLFLHWKEKQKINKISLFFDTDYDHPMESVQMGHNEDVMPFVVRNYVVEDEKGNSIASEKGNYQTMVCITLVKTVETHSLTIYIDHPSRNVPASMFQVICS